MPFAQNALEMFEIAHAAKKSRDDLEDAFLHTLDKNRKLQAEVNMLRNPPARERFRDHLVAITKTWLPAAETQDHLDRVDRETKSVHQMTALQTQLLALHTRLQKQTVTIEKQYIQLSSLNTARTLLQSERHDLLAKQAADAAKIAHLETQLSYQTAQTNNLVVALDRERRSM